MAVVLDQSFRTGVRLTNLALGAIRAEEPVVAQRVCVLLLRDPDALRRLFLEALETPRAHGHVRAQLQMAHGSSHLLWSSSRGRHLPDQPAVSKILKFVLSQVAIGMPRQCAQ